MIGARIGSTPAVTSRSPLIAFAGDSVTFATVQQNTATVTQNVNRGASFWVPFLTKQRARTRQNLNFGVSGDTSAQLLARIGPVVACDADYVVVHIGTNNLNGGITGTTFSDFQADMRAIWSRLINADKTVIAVPPLARDLATAANRHTLWRMIRWVREQQSAGWRNFHVVDPNPLFVDPLSATGAPLANITYDGLHPKAEGAELFSRPIAALASALAPALNENAVTSAADVFNATDNPTGNLFANFTFTGTGGTLTANGAIVSGTIPNSWLSEVFVNGGTVTSLTVAHSAPAAGADGRPRRQIALGGTYVGGFATFISFRQLLTNYSDFQAGDQVVCEVEYETDAAAYPGCIAGVYATFQATMSGVTPEVRDGYAGSFADSFSSQAHDGMLRTPPLVITAQPTFMSGGLGIQLRQFGASVLTAASTVRIKGVSLRKVIA